MKYYASREALGYICIRSSVWSYSKLVIYSIAASTLIQPMPLGSAIALKLNVAYRPPIGHIYCQLDSLVQSESVALSLGIYQLLWH